VQSGPSQPVSGICNNSRGGILMKEVSGNRVEREGDLCDLGEI